MIATIVASIGFILNSFVSDLTTIIIFVGAVSGKPFIANNNKDNDKVTHN